MARMHLGVKSRIAYFLQRARVHGSLVQMGE